MWDAVPTPRLEKTCTQEALIETEGQSVHIWW
jgi:hypothetical protein